MRVRVRLGADCDQDYIPALATCQSVSHKLGCITHMYTQPGPIPSVRVRVIPSVRVRVRGVHSVRVRGIPSVRGRGRYTPRWGWGYICQLCMPYHVCPMGRHTPPGIPRDGAGVRDLWFRLWGGGLFPHIHTHVWKAGSSSMQFNQRERHILRGWAL